VNLLPFVGDARNPAIKPIDAVLIDVPCTGTGTFRRHPDARWRIKVSDIAVMSALQKQILRAAALVVAKDGLLIYSTCSLEPEETTRRSTHSSLRTSTSCSSHRRKERCPLI
jgi:16S rRNA (cytosine967-C5)-methyltransferase